MEDLINSGLRLSYLNTFMVVARKKSLLEASKELNLAQSTVSMRIAAVEKAFNARLFDRTLYGVRLTRDGERVLKAINNIHKVLRDVSAEFETREGAVKETLTIDSCIIPALYILPPVIKRFKEKHAGIRPVLRITQTSSAINNLKNGSADVVCVGTVGYQNEYVVKNCEVLPVGQDLLVLAVPPDHELASRENVELKDVLRYPFISPHRGTDTYQEVEKLLNLNGFNFENLNVFIELQTPESILMAVERDMGISILSSYPVSAAEANDQVRMLRIAGINDVRTFYIARKKEDKNKRCVREFWNFVATHCLPQLSH
jgi:DNA-binding transcriptional LysR family regulator